MPYLNHNGSLTDVKTPLFTATNRAFCYGDAIFETMRIRDRKILYLDDHLERLKKGLQYLKLELPKSFTRESFIAMVEELMTKNQISKNGRLRTEVYRNEGGYYISSSTQASFVITAEPLDSDKYLLNEKGFMIDVFDEVTKTRDKLSNLKSSNKLPFVLAGLYMREKGLDDCIILNTDNKIAETINSNLFFLKNDEYYTPSVDQGCIDGVMRRNMIRLLEKEGKKVHECSLLPSDLLNADEIFLTNVIQGIRWVGAFKQKRYFNTTSRWLTELLNAFAYPTETL